MSFVSHSSNILYTMPFSHIQQWVIENNFHREYHITMHVIILLYMVVIFFAVGKKTAPWWRWNENAYHITVPPSGVSGDDQWIPFTKEA